MAIEVTDDTPLWFGPYRGTKMANVPDEYLLNLYNSGKCFGNLKTYIEENLDVIKSNVKRNKE